MVLEERYWIDLSYCWYSCDEIQACGLPLLVLGLLWIKHAEDGEDMWERVGSIGWKCFGWMKSGGQTTLGAIENVFLFPNLECGSR